MHAQILHQLDTGTTCLAVILVANCCQLSYIPYVYRHCDLLVLKIIIHINVIKRIERLGRNLLNTATVRFGHESKLVVTFFIDQKRVGGFLLLE